MAKKSEFIRGRPWEPQGPARSDPAMIHSVHSLVK